MSNAQMNASQKPATVFGGMLANVTLSEVTETVLVSSEESLPLVPAVPTVEKKELLPKMPVMDNFAALVPMRAETDAQAVQRTGMKRGQLVRLPDDSSGNPVRKKIKSIDGNGQVSFAGTRKKIPAGDLREL